MSKVQKSSFLTRFSLFLRWVSYLTGTAAVVLAGALHFHVLDPELDFHLPLNQITSIGLDYGPQTSHPSADVPALKDIPLAVQYQPFDRNRVLADLDHRISDDFIIPPSLLSRVGFWFDIYSRYDSNKKIIHFALYPWVVFRVIDVEPIINAEYPKHRWLRNVAADKQVKKELNEVKASLKRIANTKSKTIDPNRLSESDQLTYKSLSVLGGDIRRHARNALREIRVQTGQRDFIAEGLQVAPRYLPKMEAIFRANKLPYELTRLPLVESSFNKHAQSKVGAAGIWQFMESTGRRNKLIVNNMVDERRSPLKATEAAARLLKENHLILSRSWELAISAWNHGPSGIKKATKMVKTKDLARIIELYHSRTFDFASENFYSEFLAALYTERYSNLIFPGLPKMPEAQIAMVELKRAAPLRSLLETTRLSEEEFVTINPDLSNLLKKKKTLPKGLRIFVPTLTLQAVEAITNSKRFVSQL